MHGEEEDKRGDVWAGWRQLEPNTCPFPNLFLFIYVFFYIYGCWDIKNNVERERVLMHYPPAEGYLRHQRCWFGLVGEGASWILLTSLEVSKDVVYLSFLRFCGTCFYIFGAAGVWFCNVSLKSKLVLAHLNCMNLKYFCFAK